MKIKFFGREVILIVCFVFLLSALTFAAEKDVMKVQGQVASLNLKNKRMVLFETTFVWDSNTMFLDEKGSPIAADKLKARSWVYIEGIRENNKPMITIKKIYLLPKRIGPGERDQYPFMQ